MAKHLFYKLSTDLLLLLLLSACGELREIEQTDCAFSKIDFTIDDSLAGYSGTMEYSGKNSDPVPLKEIGFFLLPQISGGSLSINSVNSPGNDIKWDISEAVLTISFLKVIEPDSDYHVEIHFSGTVPQNLKLPGIFFRTESTLALGHFYPMAIPSDGNGSFTPIQPSFRGDPVESILSRFDVNFQAPSRLRFAASGPVQEESRKGDRITYSVKTGPVRDFYLHGSQDWDMVWKIYKGIHLTAWYPKGRMQQGIDSLYYMEDALKIFERRLGPYPYNTLHIVSGPLGPQAGGMEYPGIIVMNDDYYTEEDSFSLQIILAHEIGHQWFYNLVGNDPVMEPWIDESFAQYTTWLYFEELYGSRAGNRIFSFFENRWSRVRKAPIPLNLSSHEYKGREYGAIPYGKGPLFLFSLRTRFGEELFDSFILDYQKTFRWERMNTEKLRNFMYDYFGEEGDLMFRNWVYGET